MKEMNLILFFEETCTLFIENFWRKNATGSFSLAMMKIRSQVVAIVDISNKKNDSPSTFSSQSNWPQTNLLRVKKKFYNNENFLKKTFAHFSRKPTYFLRLSSGHARDIWREGPCEIL